MAFSTRAKKAQRESNLKPPSLKKFKFNIDVDESNFLYPLNLKNQR